MNCVSGIYYPKDSGKCWVYDCLKKGNVWEKSMLNKFVEIINEGDTVIDCGANIGLHSLELSLLVGDNGNVFSFEAIPAIYDCLNKTIELNEIENITTINNGLFSKDNEDLVFKSDLSGRSGLYRKSSVFTKSFTVKSITLDTYFKDYDKKIHFIKIDVEGCEFEVLEGAKELIKKHKPKIIVEVWKSITRTTQLFKWLEENDYSLEAKVSAGDYLLVPSF